MDTTSTSQGRTLIYASLLAIGLFFAWASWAEIDQVTRVPGTVIPSARNQIIQVPEPGVIDEILVGEGHAVKAGQVLMRFRRIQTEAAYRESLAEVSALRATVARLTAEVLDQEPKFPKELQAFPELMANNRALFSRRRAALNEELAVLARSLWLVNEEIALSEPLLANGDISKVEVLRLKRQATEIQGKITNRKNSYLQDAQAELSKAQEKLDSQSQALARHMERMNQTDVVSPMDGVVRNVRFTTLGGVARMGDELMQIVPADDRLLVECKVKPVDIAYVKIGLAASVKLDAYDYTIYGTFPGVVDYISADTLREEARTNNEEPYFRVHVRLERNEFVAANAKHVQMQAGMTATADIVTGRHTVMHYLFKPIIKTMSESLSER
ncbi:MAG: HlyD family type I secretion periplasmic adaptor subunit [Magnetococcales bacterium]|nr:HlyD family type I secretion periplasmic adaptor subunit [Magnetococcales bacterium]